LSILKRIEEIVLAAESKLRSLNQPAANHSDSPLIKAEAAASNESSAEPDGNLQLEFERVEY
jgi:hypothetical protein